MKQLIFVGNHKNFDALRLGVRLAQVLQTSGQTVILGGVKGKLPKESGLSILEFAPTASSKTWAAHLKKAGVQRVISLVSLPICEAAALNKIPYVYCEPENFKEEKTVKNKKTILKNAQKVLVLGENTKALDKKRYGANAMRIKNPAVWTEHGVGVWPKAFKKGNNIVAIAPFGKQGGLEHLLAAWAKLAGLHPSWHLTICAEGTGKAPLQKFIVKNQLQPSTELISTGEMTPLIAHADIFVRPVLTAEKLELLLDAMASKLPVVAVKNSGAEAFITDNVDGKLIDATDPQHWVAVLDELMVDWGKRVGLAVQAHKMKDRFPFEVFASFFEEA